VLERGDPVESCSDYRNVRKAFHGLRVAHSATRSSSHMDGVAVGDMHHRVFLGRKKYNVSNSFAEVRLNF